MKNKKEKKQEEEELTGMAAVWDYLKTFLIIFCVVFAMNKLVYINAVIPSESMQNTIMKGDRVLGNRLAYIKDDPERYDIVISILQLSIRLPRRLLHLRSHIRGIPTFPTPARERVLPDRYRYNRRFRTYPKPSFQNLQFKIGYSLYSGNITVFNDLYAK